MSMPKEETVTCPYCGKTVECTSWHSINTELDFAVPDIISGKLFETVCDGCGKILHLDYPLLFNDMNHQVMIDYVPQEKVREAVRASDLMRSMGGRVRIVTEQTALREKVAIFDAGLDDRIVEILKLLAVSQIADQLKDKPVEYVYFVPDEEHPALELHAGGENFSLAVNMDGYGNLEERFREKLADTDMDLFIGPQWALNFLQNSKKDN